MQTSGKSCREKENMCLRPEMGLPPHHAIVLAQLGDRKVARTHRSERRLDPFIATSFIEVLRRPTEPALDRPVRPGDDAKLLLPRMPIQSPGAFSWTRL